MGHGQARGEGNRAQVAFPIYVFFFHFPFPFICTHNTRICIHEYMYIRSHALIYTHIHTLEYTHTPIHIFMYTHLRISIHVYTCLYIIYIGDGFIIPQKINKPSSFDRDLKMVFKDIRWVDGWVIRGGVVKE